MKLKSLDDVYVVSDKLAPVSQQQLDRARAALDTEFPPGYDDFMLKFGKGDYSAYLRPYDPDRVVSELSSNRENFATDYWTEGELRLTDAERTSLIPFADTIDGDMFRLPSEKAKTDFCAASAEPGAFQNRP